MGLNRFLGAALVCLVIALVTGLLFNGIPVIKNMPTVVKTSYMNIWVPAVFGVLGALGLYKGFKTRNKNAVAPDVTTVSTNTLTPPLNQNTLSTTQSKQPPSSKSADPEPARTMVS